ncbi:hypothetical protein, partial [Klebsiella pneumoniae]|uniref:hypothetical protein n=1 Tax=Klebsiella pneumoniae TaxID=573 RepID=UPI0030135732
GAVSTMPSGINPEGTIVGMYQDTSGRFHGYLQSADTFNSFDPPGSIFTSFPKINPKGEIVGYFESADSNTHVYLLSGGAFTTMDPPGPILF